MSANAMLLLGLGLLSFAHTYAAVQRPGVLDTIKSGLEYASSYIDIAKDIADLVATSLGHEKRNRGDNGSDQPSENFAGKKKYFGNQGLVAAFFKLLGLDPTKINAIAVNSAIFLAQMISTAFNLKSKLDRSRGMDLKLEEDQDPLTEDGNWIRGPMRLILDSTNERPTESCKTGTRSQDYRTIPTPGRRISRTTETFFFFQTITRGLMSFKREATFSQFFVE
ncbi:uncharacterized protein LOC124307379 isoform X2 [Neodiprion virginianus]|uniref:uncharacterized protein LOC124307379 isoform X2 n=1 Tax=Neodiprion virginianus TaxID=2961670 RepID=UPI001EE76D1A|nr:uncharacterized protein LOC124307379 isoform X2 [Neodiprion virginianus]